MKDSAADVVAEVGRAVEEDVPYRPMDSLSLKHYHLLPKSWALDDFLE